MTFSFPEHHALVTGGASGIGRAVALAFAAAGCRVTATGLTDAEMTDARASFGERLTVAKLDVTDAAAVTALVGRFDRLDFLVKNFSLINSSKCSTSISLARCACAALAGRCWPSAAGPS